MAATVEPTDVATRTNGHHAASGLEERFLTLHEIVRAAKANLPPGPWDYLVGGSETETTLRRNRLALDSLGSGRASCATSRRSTRARRGSAGGFAFR